MTKNIHSIHWSVTTYSFYFHFFLKKKFKFFVVSFFFLSCLSYMQLYRYIYLYIIFFSHLYTYTYVICVSCWSFFLFVCCQTKNTKQAHLIISYVLYTLRSVCIYCFMYTLHTPSNGIRINPLFIIPDYNDIIYLMQCIH